MSRVVFAHQHHTLLHYLSMAPGKKKGQGAAKRTPQKGTGHQPSPKPAPKEKSKCPRCYEKMILTAHPTDHKLNKCSRFAKFEKPEYIAQMWDGCSQMGSEDQKSLVTTAIEAESLLTDAFPNKHTSFNGHPVTKYLPSRETGIA